MYNHALTNPSKWKEKHQKSSKLDNNQSIFVAFCRYLCTFAMFLEITQAKIYLHEQSNEARGLSVGA